MTADRLRAVVLCAGLGTRLRPLTLEVAKPLVPVCGEPVVARTLRTLAAAGCERVGINLHHRGTELARALGSRFDTLPLVYSEEPDILGTAGALVPMRSLLREATAILLVNGDALCDWPWAKMLTAHERSGAAVTLLLHKTASPAAYGGGVGIDSDGRVVQLRDAAPVGTVARRYVFTGAHVLDPSLLDRLTPGPADIVADLYIPLLADGGPIQSVVTSRRWHDLGTPARYLAAVLDWARGSVPRRLWRGSWSADDAQLADGAIVQRAVVEARARIGADARVTDSLLLPGAVVGAGSRVHASIIGPRVTLPDGAHLEDRLVHNHVAGYRPTDGASIIGNRVYVPI